MTWGVAVARPLSERKAERFLTARGWEPYIPRMLNVLRHEVLMFPRYVFVKLTEQWCGISRVPGVSKLLLSCERPAVISETFISDLRAMEDKSGLVRLPPKTLSGLRIGQVVRVKRGALAGQCGLYQGMTANERELVLLNALGVLSMPVGNLEAA